MGIIASLRNAFSRTPKPLDGPVGFDEHEIRIYAPTETRIRWAEIYRIVTYKIDLLTYDEIRVQIEGNRGSAIVVTEESPGFGTLMEEVARRYPTARHWHSLVSQPPLAESWTVLYDASQERT